MIRFLTKMTHKNVSLPKKIRGHEVGQVYLITPSHPDTKLRLRSRVCSLKGDAASSRAYGPAMIVMSSVQCLPENEKPRL